MMKKQPPSRAEACAQIATSPFAQFAEQLQSQLRGSVRLRQVTRDGWSRFGGLPRVSEKFDWPFWDARAHFERELKYAEHGKANYGTPFWDTRISELEKVLANSTRRPLLFLAQVDLAAIPDWDCLPRFQRSGVLYFFADMVNVPPCTEPASRGSWRVIHAPRGTGDNQLELPALNEHEGAEEFLWLAGCMGAGVPCEPSLEWSLPTEMPEVEAVFNEDQYLDDDEMDALERKYQTLVKRLSQKGGKAWHRMFGHAGEIQNPMERSCQLASAGISHSDSDAYCRDYRDLEKGTQDWRLLLQLDTDARVPFGFGDSGRCYFWAREQALSASDFSEVWGEMQSC